MNLRNENNNKNSFQEKKRIPLNIIKEINCKVIVFYYSHFKKTLCPITFIKIKRQKKKY